MLMPSYVNIGARVGDDTMVDTWATVGSCAQIGERVHLSGGVGIGGVLEPPQAAPVIVGDDAMIGVALHRRRGRARRRRARARRRRDPQPVDPGDRRRDRRRGRPRASCPTGASPCRPPGRGRSPAASSACRACCRAAPHRGRAPRQGEAQRHPPRARRRHVTPAVVARRRRPLRAHRGAGRGPVGEPRRDRARRLGRGAAAARARRARPSTGSATT